MLAIFALLAVPLRSYVQPASILTAVPFGVVGAVWGHMALGLDFTLMSMMGVVALSGVVVNDSLLLVDAINRGRDADRGAAGLQAAVREAGGRRFRPIVLTSLTDLPGLGSADAGAGHPGDVRRAHSGFAGVRGPLLPPA